MNANNLNIQIVFPGDYGAVGYYRMLFPMMQVRAATRDVRFIDSNIYLGDPNIFRGCKAVRFQRPQTMKQLSYFQKFLKPLSETFGFWIFMDVDDCLVYKDIPQYNIARLSFDQNIGEIIKKSMELSDFVTVSTDYLKEYYKNEFGLPANKLIVRNNYLAKWWIGNHFDISGVVSRHGSKKPKIGFVCGGNHYDLNNMNNGIDDFTHIVPWIREHENDFDFHFVGGVPVQLRNDLEQGKIFLESPTTFLEYPNKLVERQYDIWICPLQDNLFNRCKSNIKLLEAWAVGVPIFVQKCECYDRYTEDRFETADDLENLVSSLLSMKKQEFKDKLIFNRSLLDKDEKNSPKGWWIEDNMEDYYKTLLLPQRTIKVGING